MRKKLTLSFILFTFCFCLYAQGVSVSGIVTDTENNVALIGTHLSLGNISNTWTLTTDDNGKFSFKNVPNGEYALEISYIGYQVNKQEIQVNGQDINLKNISLTEGVDLDEVQVVENVLPVIQKGDTTQFNAQAYKTLPDADASELIEKMPTVVVEDGTVQAQGEDVKQVLVDGKSFFGNDPQAALRNLPAEVIDKIQIFDQQSDQAKFTGFDDGEATKTINIITKRNMRNGQFGKVYAGYGTDDRYQAGGNINLFNGDQRISIIGLSNNINRQNFSSEDLLGVVGSSGRGRGGRRGGGRPGGGRRGGGRLGGGSTSASASDFLVPQQGGITAANAFGLNFTDKWGQKVEVSASYFFNESNNITDQILTQQYFDVEGLAEIYEESSIAESTNLNHRVNGILNFKINDKNSLIWRSNMTFQGNDGEESLLGETNINNVFVNSTNSDYTANLQALNLTNSLLWRHNFEKDLRTLSIFAAGGLAPNEGERFLLSENIFSADTTSLNQNSILDVDNQNASANIQFTEPVSENGQLSFSYRLTYRQEESSQNTFDFDDSSESFDIFNQDLSNVFSNDYLSHSVGTGFRFNKGSWRFMTRANVQQAELITEQTFPFEADTQNEFFNVLPMAMAMYRPSRSKNFRVFYRTRTSLPTTSQLQNVINNTNPIQLTTGNPDLLQGVQHTLNGSYNKTNTEKSTVFFILLGGGVTENYISNSTFLSAADFDPSLETDAQITVPENLDGYYNLRAFSTYGFPLSKIKSNLNIDLNANHSRTPGLINGDLNLTNNSTAGLGLTISSNVSDRVDFTVSTRSNMNFVSNTLQSESTSNFLSQNSKVKLNWIIGKGIIFRTDLNHFFYDGLAEDFDQNFLLWNISIGKKLFKDDRGEISLVVFDALNQNNALTRNITETYTEDLQTNVLQQYFMLNFKYDVRHFRVKK
jgi:uncharacterized membrane protein YgcG